MAGTGSQWMSRAARVVVDITALLMPRTCACCKKAIHAESGKLCAVCAWELVASVGGSYCATCGEDRSPHLLIDGTCTACRLGKSAPRFDRFVRAGRYDGTLRALVLRFKRAFVLDHLLGRMLGDAIQGQFNPRLVDFWIPVPSHWRRRLTLGFQPTALLARAAVRDWHGQVEPALKMTRYVRPFHIDPVMSAQERMQAIKGAFRVAKPSVVAGRRLCIIDDVTTTGATLHEAKRALVKAGAARVFAAVVAKVSSLPS